MKQIRIYSISIFILCAVMIVHYLGIHGMYAKYQLYDIIPHLLAGLGAGLFLSGFIAERSASFGKRQGFMVVAAVFAVAFCWEIFEIYTNTAGYVLFTPQYYADTVKDITMGVLGSIIAVLAAKKIFEDER